MPVSTTRERLPTLLASTVVDPDPQLVGHLGNSRDGAIPGAEPAVTRRALARAERALLLARIDGLERRLSVNQRRHDETVRRYERILDRRTERFRDWVERGDPRPDEFEWIGRSSDPSPSPTDGLTPGASVATDGGQNRRGNRDRRNPLHRLVSALRNVVR